MAWRRPQARHGMAAAAGAAGAAGRPQTMTARGSRCCGRGWPASDDDRRGSSRCGRGWPASGGARRGFRRCRHGSPAGGSITALPSGIKLLAAMGTRLLFQKSQRDLIAFFRKLTGTHM